MLTTVGRGKRKEFEENLGRSGSTASSIELAVGLAAERPAAVAEGEAGGSA